MPIDYSRYPTNWKAEIVPRILVRAENLCEVCGVKNRAELTSTPLFGSDLIDLVIFLLRGLLIPKTKRNISKVLQLTCDDESDTFIVRHTNQGEPFREGIQIGVENMEFKKEVSVMLLDYEAKQLRDLLITLYPI